MEPRPWELLPVAQAQAALSEGGPLAVALAAQLLQLLQLPQLPPLLVS